MRKSIIGLFGLLLTLASCSKIESLTVGSLENTNWKCYVSNVENKEGEIVSGDYNLWFEPNDICEMMPLDELDGRAEYSYSYPTATLRVYSTSRSAIFPVDESVWLHLDEKTTSVPLLRGINMYSSVSNNASLERRGTSALYHADVPFFVQCPSQSCSYNFQPRNIHCNDSGSIFTTAYLFCSDTRQMPIATVHGLYSRHNALLKGCSLPLHTNSR